MVRAARARAWSVLAVVAASGACDSRPPTLDLPAAWTALMAEAPSRPAVYAAVALYEGYAADSASGLPSLGGKLNGLWSLPMAADTAVVDGAIAAAEAARVVLDSLWATDTSRRRVTDSLVASQVEVRRRARIRPATREQSRAHGRAIAAAVLNWAAGDGHASRSGMRPLVLRNAAECATATSPDAISLGDSLDAARAWLDSASFAGPPTGAWFVGVVNSDSGGSPPSAADVAALAAVRGLIVADATITRAAAPRQTAGRRSTSTAEQRAIAQGRCVTERVLGRVGTD